MKKVMQSLILALVLSFVPSLLFAANFIEIYRDDGVTCFLDISSIQDQEAYYKAWQKTQYNTREEKKKAGERLGSDQEVDYVLTLNLYEKKNKRIATLAGYFYGNDGKIITSYNVEKNPISWVTVVPGSIGEVVIDAVYYLAGK